MDPVITEEEFIEIKSTVLKKVERDNESMLRWRNK
jgi:hypothetical protein